MLERRERLKFVSRCLAAIVVSFALAPGSHFLHQLAGRDHLCCENTDGSSPGGGLGSHCSSDHHSSSELQAGACSHSRHTHSRSHSSSASGTNAGHFNANDFYLLGVSRNVLDPVSEEPTGVPCDDEECSICTFYSQPIVWIDCEVVLPDFRLIDVTIEPEVMAGVPRLAVPAARGPPV